MSPFKLLLWYFESALWYVLLRNMHVFVLTWQKRKEICLNFLILYLALRWKSFKEFLYLTIVLRHTIQLIYFRNYESQIKCLGIVAPLLMSLSFFFFQFIIYHLFFSLWRFSSPHHWSVPWFISFQSSLFSCLFFSSQAALKFLPFPHQLYLHSLSVTFSIHQLKTCSSVLLRRYILSHCLKFWVT